MAFDASSYGPVIAEILALDQHGERLIPLTAGTCSSTEAFSRLAGRSARDLFPRAPAPEAALAGLWLYFSCFDESHRVAQDVHSSEGSLWHAIAHRQEPDSENAAYWFRRAGPHPIFPDLGSISGEILARDPEREFHLDGPWDPFAYIAFCEKARHQPGSTPERAALEIQRAEWQLLFDYCARPRP